MTIVIALNRNDFSMIATDSRITLLDQSEKLYDDSFHKLCTYGPIWLAGTGYGPLITLFRSNLESTEFSSVDQMESLFKAVCDYALQNMVLEEKQLLSLKYTAIVYSLPYIENGIIKTVVEGLDQENGRRGLATNKVLTLPPAKPETMEHLIPVYKSLIESSTVFDDVVYNTACFINEVSRVNQSVSNICDFGFLIKDHEGLLLKVNIRESADTIIKEYALGNLRKYWRVLDTYPLQS